MTHLQGYQLVHECLLLSNQDSSALRRTTSFSSLFFSFIILAHNCLFWTGYIRFGKFLPLSEVQLSTAAMLTKNASSGVLFWSIRLNRKQHSRGHQWYHFWAMKWPLLIWESLLPWKWNFYYLFAKQFNQQL